jgi:N-methylhydantoinase B
MTRRVTGSSCSRSAFGGIPGRPMGDGPDGHSLWPGFTNVPNEFLERYFPLLIERYETEPDSGGAGLHRGGNGIHMTYRFLSERHDLHP